MSSDRAQFEKHRDQVRERLRRPASTADRVRVMGESYEVVGDCERVDKDWEAVEAADRRAAWNAGREGRLAERMAERSRLSAGERLDAAVRELQLRLGGMKSRSIAAMRAGSDDPSKAPPGTETSLPVARHLTLIAHHVEAIERELDAQDGLRVEEVEGDRPGAAGGYGNARMMRTAERDRIVFDEFQGVHAEQVAAEAPYLGTSGRTIERARVAEAERRQLRVRPSDGVVLGEAVAA